ncbi:hypothetical protein EK904_003740 [Melospiza melodia maxima]|nr:hypothetical protein EK904_003740 [Melospiza melodia maxima]
MDTCLTLQAVEMSGPEAVTTDEQDKMAITQNFTVVLPAPGQMQALQLIIKAVGETSAASLGPITETKTGQIFLFGATSFSSAYASHLFGELLLPAERSKATEANGDFVKTKTFGFDLLHLWPASDDMEFLPWKQSYRAYLARDKQQFRGSKALLKGGTEVKQRPGAVSLCVSPRDRKKEVVALQALSLLPELARLSTWDYPKQCQQVQGEPAPVF